MKIYTVAVVGCGRIVCGAHFPAFERLGADATSIRAKASGNTVLFCIRYTDDRSATMTFSPVHPFTAYLSRTQRSKWAKISSVFFAALIADILRFYECCPPFEPSETLEVIKLREGALRARSTPDEWITL